MYCNLINLLINSLRTTPLNFRLIMVVMESKSGVFYKASPFDFDASEPRANIQRNTVLVFSILLFSRLSVLENLSSTSLIIIPLNSSSGYLNNNCLSFSLVEGVILFPKCEPRGSYQKRTVYNSGKER